MSDQIMAAALRFVTQVDRLDDPHEILAELHKVARLAALNVLGSWRVPAAARRGDRSSFPHWHHSSVPAGFRADLWTEYAEHGRSFLADLAWRNERTYTMTEALRIAKPTGADRWAQQLFLRHGIRDVLYVPNGAWMTVYWSPKAIRLDASIRAVLTLAANATAARLQRLAGHRRDQDADPGLSARQRAVLRLLSQGSSLQEAAEHLQIGYRTAKEHLSRAQAKLGAKSVPHAIAEALRRYLVIAFASLAFVVAMCSAISRLYGMPRWSVDQLEAFHVVAPMDDDLLVEWDADDIPAG
jgi:DNA-binding CsgD family transcriptional regulator